MQGSETACTYSLNDGACTLCGVARLPKENDEYWMAWMLSFAAYVENTRANED